MLSLSCFYNALSIIFVIDVMATECYTLLTFRERTLQISLCVCVLECLFAILRACVCGGYVMSNVINVIGLVWFGFALLRFHNHPLPTLPRSVSQSPSMASIK